MLALYTGGETLRPAAEDALRNIESSLPASAKRRKRKSKNTTARRSSAKRRRKDASHEDLASSQPTPTASNQATYNQPPITCGDPRPKEQKKVYRFCYVFFIHLIEFDNREFDPRSTYFTRRSSRIIRHIFPTSVRVTNSTNVCTGSRRSCESRSR